MTGGLKTFSFFPPFKYIYLTLFKYMYAYGKQIHLTLSGLFFFNPHRDLDKPHEAD